VLAGCTGNLNSPHSRAGEPCTASFLLCLSCPNARATPAHLPVQVLTADMLTARREHMTPLDWAQRFADPATRQQRNPLSVPEHPGPCHRSK
jgi:hypothetical protein